ncbi:MAG: hypothetical protein DRJ41_02485 [Thermoprotei archaeon]|nr:MAG: hypothetical protein DRJ41_02485 [Thermoprotei archaeon]
MGVMAGSRIRVIPLADESLGVRSMSLYVETDVVNILLDAGVSLAPKRYGLPPHPLEFKALKEARNRILSYSKKADIITISHYHLDHYTPGYTSWYEWSTPEMFREIYSDKVVLAKDISSKINFNQRRRGFALRRELERIGSKLVFVDEKEYEVGDVKVGSSTPFPHGPEGTKLGYVLIITVSYHDEKIVYAPDVQGPVSDKALRYITSKDPTLIIVGGPPLYLSGTKLSEKHVSKGLNNLKFLIKKYNLILSHHLLRDINWKRAFNKEELQCVKLYSDFHGTNSCLLEANRKLLYEAKPPSEDFLKWIANVKHRREEPPPLS